MSDDERPIVSRLTMELAMAGVLLGIALVLLTGATGHGIGWSDSGPEPGQVPFLVACVLALASLGIAGEALWKRGRTVATFLNRTEAHRVVTLFLPLLGYIAAVYWLGLYVPTFVYIGAVMLLQGRYSAVHSVGVASITVVAMYFIFEKWFQIDLLKGPVESWLGLH
ncbi:hypothetical protein ASE63_16815 [Bosea sp. Root381]|jgi:hypothetical protein|uniref:tripartite tricarboxylate transporter TctB family protein n=1 Tax=Bosea sp. Root381 TaxID=1736524 RepID=UPI0006F497F8|nr:tripartite tricarboxylate transporter TctB family protein [Bosea sp. Root381]KRE15879.1 hypothetical protein ASE63_16815 [Bosea sp. Root381]